MVVPHAGDSCTFSTTDQLYHKGDLVAVVKTTVVSVTDDGVVTSRREVLTQGPQGTEPVGTTSTSIRNSYGVLESGNRKFSPYIPIRGESARTGPDVLPGSNLGEVTYTLPGSNGQGTITRVVTGTVSDWDDVVVPAGKFHVLRFTWRGHYQVEQFRALPVENVFTMSAETHCAITDTFETHGRLGVFESRRTELVAYEKASPQSPAVKTQ